MAEGGYKYGTSPCFCKQQQHDKQHSRNNINMLNRRTQQTDAHESTSFLLAMRIRTFNAHTLFFFFYSVQSAAGPRTS
jgi:hypothetical protein